MKPSVLLVGALAQAVAAAAPSLDCTFTDDAPDCVRPQVRIPTAAESAVMGRRILAKSKLGTLSTVFPDKAGRDGGGASAREQRPAGFGGVPVGLVDYVADCEDGGNPTILAIKIATSFKNVQAGSNLSLAMRWVPPYAPAKRIGVLDATRGLFSSLLGGWPHWPGRKPPSAGDGDDDDEPTPDTTPYSAANLPRFSLFGYTEWIEPDADADAALRACFVRKHPDAKFWLPGNHIHSSAWMRLVVTDVYWIGGFGDRAYIGWIPVEDWRRVTREQWSSIRLQGETEGWSEWAMPTPATAGEGMAAEYDL